MQAIITKFMGNSHRIQAKAYGGTVYNNWDYSIEAKENHERAAKLLMAKLEWNHVKIIGSGELPDTSGYAFILGSK